MEIPDLRVLKLLLESGVVVICAGGGGIPVVRLENGSLVGVEAVIDKDASSALLAAQLGADALLLLTDVDAVYQGYATPAARLSIAQARELVMPAGSMGPKVNAACDFAASGGVSAIGRLQDALAMLDGDAGTRITQAARP